MWQEHTELVSSLTSTIRPVFFWQKNGCLPPHDMAPNTAPQRRQTTWAGTCKQTILEPSGAFLTQQFLRIMYHDFRVNVVILSLFYRNNPDIMVSCHFLDCGIRLGRIMIFCLIPHETFRH